MISVTAVVHNKQGVVIVFWYNFLKNYNFEGNRDKNAWQISYFLVKVLVSFYDL